MALISCSECAREISDQAVSCPGCGVPLNSNSTLTSEHVSDLKKEVKKLRRSEAYNAGEELGEDTASGLLWLAGNKYMALFWCWLAGVIGAFFLGDSVGLTQQELGPAVFGWFVIGALLVPIILVWFLRKPIQKFVPIALTTIIAVGGIGLYVAFYGFLIYVAYRMLSG